MKKHKILVYGAQNEILETVIQLINQREEWFAEGSTAEEKVIELFYRTQYDMVLLGGGISEQSEKKLRALFQMNNTDLLIVQHYGGGSGLLYNEIESAFETKKKSELQMIDNPFKS